MTPQQLRKLDRELGEYLDWLTDGMGRPERREAMGLYLTGLLLDGSRKSIEPLAARLVDDSTEIEGMRQRLQQCVTVSKWAEAEVFGRIAKKVDAELPDIEALVIDDTGSPRRGSTLSGSRVSTRERWAASTTARSPRASIWRASGAVRASAFDSTCPRNGPTIGVVGRKPGFPRT